LRQLLILLAALLGAPPTTVTAQVVLSECLASNRNGLRDRDGLHADWLELHNTGDGSELLTGRILADDDGHRWTLPELTLAPHNYLVVYMTGKDRRAPAAPLHANFRLGRGGGTVHLLERDGETEISRLEFGRQFDDVSYGRPQTFRSTPLVAPCQSARYLIPRSSVQAEWILSGFNDSSWTEAFGGFGFLNGPQQEAMAWIGTDLGAAMRGQSTTACFRYVFEVADQQHLTSAMLRVRCIGGYVAWLNGTEIARANIIGDIGPDTRALTWTDGADPRLVHEADIPMFSALLRDQDNVLAIRSFTAGENVFDHLLMAELWAYTPGPMTTGPLAWFEEPTPGRPNGVGNAEIAKQPRFAEDSTLSDVARAFSLRKAGKGIVRHTIDGSEPMATSPPLPDRLLLQDSAVLRARRFVNDAAPSPTASVHFTRLAAELSDYRSDLPILVVSTHGVAVETKEWVEGHIHAVATGDDGNSRLSDVPQVSTHGAIRLRGSSTLNLPKRSYAIELRKEDGRDRDVPLFGLPSSADWVLYAPHNYDQSHIRNALCYELAHRIGLPAPRWHFVELFVDTNGGAVTPADYMGLYLLVQRISTEMERVEIDRIRVRDAAEPEITGGYILKIDRPAPGDEGFDSGGQQLQYVSPKEREITDPQRAWLQRWFDDFGSTLSGPGFADPDTGYAAFIDVDEFIDYHFFHEYAKNPDAYTLSTYMHKPRGGKLRMGPIWDFDRAMRTNDAEYWVGRGARPYGWTGDNYHGWWGILFRDPAFRQRYRVRGRAMLAEELSVARVHTLIREIAAGIARAEERDRQRWPIIAAGKWHDEIADLEEWIVRRTQWFREELLETPVFTSDKGLFTIPFELSISHANTEGTLYYTTDGADPKLDDDRVSPNARIYDGPIAVDHDMQVRARVLVGDIWSRETTGSYVKSLPTLVISELMFNPQDGHRTEFVELWNHGKNTVDLSGIYVDGPIYYHFGTGPVRSLAPDQRVVIVNHEATFRDRYDCVGILLAGEFLGTLDNTEGEIVLKGPVSELVQRASYVDDWYDEADGEGYALELRTPRRFAEDKEDWQPGTVSGGTPGR